MSAFPSLPLLQNELWHRLLKEYQEQGVLVEGPLSNLHPNEMHLSKPVKMKSRNPVSKGLIMEMCVLGVIVNFINTLGLTCKYVGC